MITWLRRVPPTAWAFVVLLLVVLILVGYLAAYVHRISQPAVMAIAPYVAYPNGVCPGELMTIDIVRSSCAPVIKIWLPSAIGIIRRPIRAMLHRR